MPPDPPRGDCLRRSIITIRLLRNFCQLLKSCGQPWEKLVFKSLIRRHQKIVLGCTIRWLNMYFLFVTVDAESVLYGVRGNQEVDLDELTFKLIVRSRDRPDSGPPYTVTLMAPSAQEKAAWTSDISQVTIQTSTQCRP